MLRSVLITSVAIVCRVGIDASGVNDSSPTQNQDLVNIPAAIVAMDTIGVNDYSAANQEDCENVGNTSLTHTREVEDSDPATTVASVPTIARLLSRFLTSPKTAADGS